MEDAWRENVAQGSTEERTAAVLFARLLLAICADCVDMAPPAPCATLETATQASQPCHHSMLITRYVGWERSWTHVRCRTERDGRIDENQRENRTISSCPRGGRGGRAGAAAAAPAARRAADGAEVSRPAVCASLDGPAVCNLSGAIRKRAECDNGAVRRPDSAGADDCGARAERASGDRDASRKEGAALVRG